MKLRGHINTKILGLQRPSLEFVLNIHQLRVRKGLRIKLHFSVRQIATVDMFLLLLREYGALNDRVGLP